MAKKTYISPVYQKRDFSNVDKIVEDATGQSPLTAVKEESTFSVETEQRKIPKAKNVKKEIVVEKKQRNVTKPLGMPVKYKDEEKREHLHTLVRIGYNEKLRVIAFEQKKTKATVLDEILKQYFESKK